MKVTVRLGEPLKSAVGSRKVSLEVADGATVADLLALLAENYPRFHHEFYERERRAAYVLFLNEEQIGLEEAQKREIAEGDTLSIFMPVAGGEYG